jgi:hypothetical protein
MSADRVDWVRGRVPRAAGHSFQPEPPTCRRVLFEARFTETFRVPTDGEPIHVDLTLNGYKIGIASLASTREDHGLDPVPEGQRAAVILWTDDTAAAFAELTSNEAPGLVPPHELLGRLLIAWVADPDGNPIQIVQDL